MSFLGTLGRGAVGVGIYTVPQAARLVRLLPATVDQIIGVEPTAATPIHQFPISVVQNDFGLGETILTFQSLMELWVGAQLRFNGVPWPIIRLAAYEASQVLGTSRPFSSGRFRTEAGKVFLSLRGRPKAGRSVLDLLTRQHVFEQVIQQSLSPDIVVRDETGRAFLWYPLGRRFSVVLDPERRFGEPIDPESGIPVSALSDAYVAEQSNVKAAAEWFGVSTKSVRDAVAFTEWLNSR